MLLVHHETFFNIGEVGKFKNLMSRNQKNSNMEIDYQIYCRININIQIHIKQKHFKRILREVNSFKESDFSEGFLSTELSS